MEIYSMEADIELMSVMFSNMTDLDDLRLFVRGGIRWPTDRTVRLDVRGTGAKDGIIYVDLPYFGSLFPLCVSPFAQNKLAEYFADCGYFVDTDLTETGSPSDIPYRLFFLTATIDAVDLETSEFKTFPDGRVMRILKLFITEEIVGSHCLFKLRHALSGETFITGELKAEIEQAGLTGFLYTKIWSSEHGPYDTRLFTPYFLSADKRKIRQVVAAKRQHARKVLAARVR